MKNRSLFKISILLMLAIGWLDALQTGTITHQPVMNHPENEPLVLYALVSSDVNVDNVRLLYRKVGEMGFIEDDMVQYGDMWRGEIPQEYLSLEGIQYFIVSTLIDGSVLTFPPDDPENAPVTVEITPAPTPQEEVAGEPVIPEIGDEQILVFSPTPGATVPFDDVYIAASLFNIDSVDVSSIRLLVDGLDVTKKSVISSDIVAYAPPIMVPGQHKVRLEVMTLQGVPLTPKMWSFNTTKKRVEKVEKEFTYRGRLSGGYSLDQIEDETLAIAKTTASFTGDWRWLRFKTDLKLTTEEDPLKQPKNRYRLSMRAGKILTISFGDFNSRLSKFTLDGKRVRGIDANLQLGLINFRLVKGELDRFIQGSLEAGKSYSFEKVDVSEDTTTGTKSFTYELNRKGYSFQKDIFAARLSFGSGKIFQLGFNLLKAKDNIESVKPVLEDAQIDITVDSSGTIPLAIPVGTYTYDELNTLINSLNNYSLKLPDRGWKGDSPQDNIVIGSDVKLSLFKHKIGVQAGWAFSMLNKDIWDGAISLAELDTLIDEDADSSLSGQFDLNTLPDPSDYEDIFVINENMVPLVPIDPDSAQLVDNPLRSIMNMPSLSYNAKATINLLNNQFAFEYIKVGPEFNSLGNPYIQKNIKEYTISDRIRLFRNRLFVNLMYKHQDDDISRTITNVTTTNTLTASLSIFPGPNLPTVNLSFRTMDRDNGKTSMDTVNVDSTIVGVNSYLEDLRDNTNTMNSTIGINYRFDMLGLNNNVSLNYISVTKADQFEDRPDPENPFETIGSDTIFYDTSFVSPDLGSDVVTISVVTQYPIPLKTTAVISINNSEFGRNAIYGKQGISTYNLNATYDLFRGRLKLLGGIDYTSGSGTDQFSRMGIKGGFAYRITEVLAARVEGEYRSKSVSEETKTSTLFRASLNYTF